MRVSQKWFVWFLVTLFFSYQFVLRLFPGLLMSELMGQFQIGATELGVLSAAYYLGYSGMQIPVGIMLDRFRPRFVLSLCALICAAGVLPLVFSKTWAFVVFGRFLVGAGSAAGFLGTAKMVRTFLPQERFTSMIGLSFSLGLGGALYGGRPTSLLMEQFGWQSVGKGLSILCVVFSIAFFLILGRIKPAEEVSTPVQQGSIWSSLTELLNYPKLFWTAVAGALMVGPLEGFGDIWGVSYLVAAYGYTKPQASLVVSFIYFGMLFGGPILSYFVQRYQAYHQVLALCGLMMGLSFAALLLGAGFLPLQALVVLMVFVGVLCCYQVVVFGLAAQAVPAHLSGLATSVTNCINMVAGSFFHLSMGWIMDYHWSGTLREGVRVYESQSYTYAISIIPVLLMLGFVAFVTLKKYSEWAQNRA